MKLTYFFPLFIATVALWASCEDESDMTLLDEIRVSASYISLPLEGGSATITVTAKDNWKAEKVVTKNDSLKWLTLSSVNGSAGETELTFTAPSAIDGRIAEVLLQCGGKSQRVNIMQGLPKATEATVAEVSEEPDGKTFRVSGVCTSISNTTYGNWYLTDDTGSLSIYGTLDADGKERNFLSLGLEVGDEVTIEGPKNTYRGEPQLVNVTVIEIRKSLAKVDSVKNEMLPVEGGEFIAYLTCKGEGVSTEIPEDAKSWLSITSIQSAGTNTVVKFKAAANPGGERSTTIIFRTTDGAKYYTTQTTLSQKGAIVKATVAEFLAAGVGDTQYRLTGVITRITHNNYGNLYLRDFSGETYVHGIQDFPDKGLKVGDIITIVGKRGEYSGSPQVASAVLESFIPVTPATIAEVLAKPDSNDDYFMVTGEITSIDDETYGNLYLKEGDSEIFLYGCYPGYGATGDDRKNLLAAKGIKAGDKLTVIATKSSYNGVDQLRNGIYFSHESK